MLLEDLNENLDAPSSLDTDDSSPSSDSDTAAESDNVGRTPKLNIAELFVSTCGVKDNAESELTDEDTQKLLLVDTSNLDVSCKVLKKIKKADFPKSIENVGRRFKLSKEQKESILEGALCEEMHETIINFGFDETKKTETFIFGRVSTVKYKGKIDMAYSFYTLEFKLPPIISKYFLEKKFLCFTYGKEEKESKEERYLNINEKECITKYISTEAIIKFRDEHEGMINVD
jgi:hypothetical protein